MAQVVPPQYEVGQGSEIRNSVRGSKEIWECLGVMTLRSLWFALLGTTLNMWECPLEHNDHHIRTYLHFNKFFYQRLVYNTFSL
jgi:hypothetical protein